MSVLSSILNSVFQHGGVTPPATTAAPLPATTPPPAGILVDTQAVLTQLAASKGGNLNWQTSIVDLLKLLDLDSSMTARHALAQELGVHAGADGTAEQNIALHRAVMLQLFLNGGNVPASMRS